jgi:pyruvate kinase
MQKLTKIVATISDLRCDTDFICALYDAGMDVVRINTAHQSPDNTLQLLKNVRKVSDKIPLMIDTKGPEIRTNDGDNAIKVEKGQHIKVAGQVNKVSTDTCIYVNYPGFNERMEVGKLIMIDDGEIALQVVEKTDDFLSCVVNNSGTIKPRKSVNLPGTKVDLPSLNEKDLEFINFAIEQDIEFLAHSFVRNREDVLAIQSILDKHNSRVKIIAKIENQQGLDNIDEILEHVYGIMVARGDLAIEVPAEKIPVIQAKLIDKCREQKKVVIIATQMLHSMISSPRPTRAEVSDVANAVFSGTDAIMLSGETAFGDYPVESVEIMTKTVREAEKGRLSGIDAHVMPHDNPISVFLSDTAVNSIHKLNTKAIITDTDTGKTARYLAAFRGRTPIYAQCYDNRVMRELALVYGVFSDHMDVATSKKEFTKVTLTRLIRHAEIDPEDLVAVLAGNFGKKAGPSFVEISTAHNMLFEGKD